jgi:hypothetical protein
MSWQNLLSNGTIQSHTTSRQEIENPRKVVNRDLKDAEIDGLSEDRRFAIAYNAVLQISKMWAKGSRLCSNSFNTRLI